jgi:hypothetical protein
LLPLCKVFISTEIFYMFFFFFNQWWFSLWMLSLLLSMINCWCCSSEIDQMH